MFFFADNSRIGNHNQEEAKTKFINVLSKAKDENISLVLSPEYSCPRLVIDEIIAKTTFQPSQQKLWVLGGESLNKEDLRWFRELENENIHIYFEDVYSGSDKNYVDPLYYIFRGKHNNVDKLIVLIQFKTRHMGGLWSNQLEADNLIEGNTIYIIKNDNQSVRLVSFICSEAMNARAAFDKDLIEKIDWIDKPFLILNPQFNPKPSHDDFITFRKFMLEEEKKEVISLNWGKDSILDKKPFYPADVNSPRSGFFFKTSETDLEYRPAYIVNNHKKGGYFLHINRGKFVCYLNGNIDLFKIENKSVHISSAALPQRRREGPTVSSIFNFSKNHDLEKIENISDNHLIFLSERGITNTYFLNPTNSIIDKERLLNISTGLVKSKEGNKWCDVIHLHSFSLNESDECNHRLTYIEDTYEQSEKIREINLTFISELDHNILPNYSLYPHCIKRLGYKDLTLSYAENSNKDCYKYNVINANQNIEQATICYIGNASNIKINTTYDDLQSLFENGSSGKDTVVVFYKRGTKILEKSNPDAGSITKTPTSNNSIV